MAYEKWRDSMCDMCGTNPDWFDPEKGGHRFAMVADTYRCPGCELKEMEQAQIPSDAKGVSVHLIANPNLAAMEE